MTRKRIFPRGIWLTLIAVVSFCTIGLGACTPDVEKLWAFPVGSPIYSTPLLINNLIVFGSESGTLHAVDRKGKARWRFQAPGSEIFSHPQTDGKLIFFGATNQSFYAIDLNGRLKWKFAALERIKSDTVVLDGVVYATSYDGHIYALKADVGKLLWQFPAEKSAEAEGEDKSSVIKPLAFSYAAPIIRNGVLFVGNMDGYMYAINTADGSLKWRYKTGGGITSTAFFEDGVLFFGSKDSHVYALDAATGTKLKWKFKTGDGVLSSPKIKDGVLYVGSNDKKLYALDPKTGTQKCSFTTNGPIISYSEFYEDLVIFNAGQGDGSLYAIQGNNCQQVYKFKTGYKIESDPAIDGDNLFVTSGDRHVYAFKINRKK
jgi:outer membrane protein assembly factor BamB